MSKIIDEDKAYQEINIQPHFEEINEGFIKEVRRFIKTKRANEKAKKKHLCYSFTFYLFEELPNKLTIYDEECLFCGMFDYVTYKTPVDMFIKEGCIMISNVTDDDLMLDMDRGIIYNGLCE